MAVLLILMLNVVLRRTERRERRRRRRIEAERRAHQSSHYTYTRFVLVVVIRDVTGIRVMLETASGVVPVHSGRVDNDRFIDVISSAAGQILRQIRILSDAILAVLLLIVIATAVSAIHVRLQIQAANIRQQRRSGSR